MNSELFPLDENVYLLADPDFHESLLNTISKVRSGAIKWHTYEEVFGEHPIQ